MVMDGIIGEGGEVPRDKCGFHHSLQVCERCAVSGGAGGGGVSGVEVGGVSGVEVGGVSGADAAETKNSDAATDAEIDVIKRLSKGAFDNEDARRVLKNRSTRKAGKRSTATPRKTGPWSDQRRRETVKRMKRLIGWVTPSKGSKDFTKREKMMVLSVKKFCERERDKYLKRVEKEDGYVKEVAADIPKVPFENVTKRTADMTGIPKRTVQRFAMQERKCQLTPKAKLGRKKFVAPDWVYSDIRIIITG